MSEESASSLAKSGAASVDDASVGASVGTMSSLGRTLVSVVDVGRELLARRRKSDTPESSGDLGALCKALIEQRCGASGCALASEIVLAYEGLNDEQRLSFFHTLSSDFDVDSQAIIDAAQAYEASPSMEQLWALNRVVEAPRQKLFRRLNTAPGGTRALVGMRGKLLALLPDNPQFRGIDSDLRHLFFSWFNKGFLELRRIDWSSPAAEPKATTWRCWVSGLMPQGRGPVALLFRR